MAKSPSPILPLASKPYFSRLEAEVEPKAFVRPKSCRFVHALPSNAAELTLT
jgi:hypothetical protein